MHSKSPSDISAAEIIFSSSSIPESLKYKDIYYSPNNGLKEAEYVFLEANDLRIRFSALKTGEQFYIAETGFGTGLNLLITAKHWHKLVPSTNSRLNYLSIEKEPLRLEDISRALSHWPELDEYRIKLEKNYPHLTPGYHRFYLTDQIQVTLILADVDWALNSLYPHIDSNQQFRSDFRVDAWYLDGFAPDKNPSMWNQELFKKIAFFSDATTTLATFTAASNVRRKLENSGFICKKMPGFGKKREMITAHYCEEKPTFPIDPMPKSAGAEPYNPWHIAKYKQKLKHPKIAIIGAGIAGTTTAYTLARNGIDVDLYDSENIANGASGNPQAAIHINLSPNKGISEDFTLASAIYASNFYSSRLHSSSLVNSLDTSLCGLVQLPKNQDHLQKMKAAAARFSDVTEFVELLDKNSLTSISNLNIEEEGLLFKKAGWVNGQNLCRSLLTHPNIKIHENLKLHTLEQTGNQWMLQFYSPSQVREPQYQAMTYDIVIICTANTAKAFDQFNWLPTKAIRGQISYASSVEISTSPQTVVCRDVFVTPEHNNRVSFGATYDLNSTNSRVLEADTRKNLENLFNLSTSFSKDNIKTDNLQNWSAVRCSTPDYLPLVGEAPNYIELSRQFNLLSKDRKTSIQQPGANLAGLYLNIGYGSKGFSYAPLCAELIAAKVLNSVPALPNYLVQAVHPARFIIRDIVRNKIRAGDVYPLHLT